VNDWLDTLFRALRKPLDALFGAEQRVFLPFLATSAAIAALVWVVSVRPHRRTSLLGYLFPRAVWLHRSALLDYRLLFLRALLGLVLVVPLFLSTIAVAVAEARALRLTFGVSSLAWSSATVAIVFTIAVFVVDDLTRYLVHRLVHRVPCLWELHKVHHSAEVLTPFTLQRVHPLEGLIMAVRATVTLGVVTGVFIWLFPGKVQAVLVLGVDAIGFAFAGLGANLRHSHVWLSYGRVLERIFISPAQHQIHHSIEREHYDRNYGASLAIWDWMFRSLYVTRGRERVTFGLPATEKNHRDTLPSLVIDPLVASARALVPRRFRRAPTPAE
jgi:sterol desaturase/sphingolipid hydroxylase (fatty acid hydroxylase superfamily)